MLASLSVYVFMRVSVRNSLERGGFLNKRSYY